MDDLLQEFLTESHEHLDTVDRQLVEFERSPQNADTLRNIFRLVHTIKGTCGFLGLPRLEALAHSAETLLGQLRDGATVTPEAVTVILNSIDRIKMILAALEHSGTEPEGSDDDLIAQLDAASAAAQTGAPAASDLVMGELTYQVLERPLKPGEVSLDDLERAFRETDGPVDQPIAPAQNPVVAPSAPPASAARPAPVLDDQLESRIASQTIRVNVGTIEHLMTMVSELVLTRNQLLEIARRQDDALFKVPLQRLSHITAELQDGVMKTRMQPIGNAWGKLPRVVRDLAAELGKKIELVMEGAETELDRQVLEQIKDPLTHMVRNSADHGIEPQHERRQLGKPETGRIRLTAAHEGGSITIRIQDDGRGLDMLRIRRKAVEQGLASAAEVEKMTDAQAARFVFHPGFSTAQAVTNVSGRGVGMDVVKSNIDAIGGTVEIVSDAGRGATITVKIPLTLAIVSALIVAVGTQRFAIPQVVVRELVRVRPGSDHAVEQLNGASVLRLRERLLPVVSLGSVMKLGGVAETNQDSGFVVVTQLGQQQFGIMVDGVLHTEEIVVKPMSARLKSLSLFSGNTILGDGAVVLILDPNGLARTVGSLDAENEARDGDTAEENQGGAQRQTMLVFRGGGGSLKAIPLSLVTRLEEIDATTIETSGGRALVQYRGKLMPVVPANDALAMKAEGPQPLVIFSDGDKTMGLAVESIVDILDDTLDIELAAGQPGVLGSAVIGGRATEIVDLAHYLPQAYPDWLAGARKARASGSRDVLLIEPSAFIREMLAPVIKAAGFNPLPCATPADAQPHLADGRRPAAIVTDVENSALGGVQGIAAAFAGIVAAGTPLIGLASIAHGALLAEARSHGLSAVIAKFDRHALMQTLADEADATREAA
jgi:two-component system chemotaxis sensor kinase CheA